MVEALIPLSLRWQHPRREFVFQPKYAADLNLIEQTCRMRHTAGVEKFGKIFSRPVERPGRAAIV